MKEIYTLQLINNLADKLQTLVTEQNYIIILKAYNRYINEETNRSNYIYDITNKNDLIALIRLGADINIIDKLYQENNKYVICNNNEFISLSMLGILKYILKEKENIAKCVLAYPFISEYKEVYTRLVTTQIIGY